MTGQSRASVGIKVSTEVNVKGRVDCYVFGENPEVVNPGDFLIVVSKFLPENGSSRGATQEVKLSIPGRDMANFLAQVTRAYDLYLLNEDWLKRPVTRTLTPDEIHQRELELAREKARRTKATNYDRPGEAMTQEWIDEKPLEPTEVPVTGNRPAPRLTNPEPRV